MKRMTAMLLALVMILSMTLSFSSVALAATEATDAAETTETAGATQAQETEAENGKINMPLEFWIVWGIAVNALTLICLSRITKSTKRKYSS